MHIPPFWLTLGFLGQALFASRFLVQWLASEKRKQSYIPNLFWLLSIGGGALLLTYAIHRRDPVIIAGQAFGMLVYLRNLWLVYGHAQIAERDDFTASQT